MKKLLYLALLFLMPLFSPAQDLLVYKDISENIKDIPASFKLNDKVSIIQINKDNDDFELAAVDDKMGILWRAPLKGYGMKCGNFKGKIVVVAANSFSLFKGLGGTYKAFMLDSKTGKLELEKTLYQGTGQNWDDVSVFFTGDGSFFKLAVRQTNLNRSFFSTLTQRDEFFETKDLTVISYNEKLEPVSTLKPPFSKNETYIGITSNEQGDLFLGMFTNRSAIQITRYDADNMQPTGTLSETVDLYKNREQSLLIKMHASRNDRTQLYWGLMHKGYSKDVQLTLGKFDFGKKIKKTTVELFDKDHIKAIQKAFVRPNKDIDKADIGSSRYLDLRYLDETNGVVLAGISGQGIMITRSGISSSAAMFEANTVINGYNSELDPKFQQVMPAGYITPVGFAPVGYHTDKNILHVIATNKDGITNLRSVYGQLDVTTGQWKQLIPLSKKSLKNAAYGSGPNALWFKNGFVLPYMSAGGFVTIKFDLSFQWVPL